MNNNNLSLLNKLLYDTYLVYFLINNLYKISVPKFI